MDYGKVENYALSLRLILFAGEVFPVDKLRKLNGLLPNVQLFNLYGPTETNVVTAHQVEEKDLNRAKPPPIGKACSHVNCALYVNGRITRFFPGGNGELIVSGSSLFSGYLGLVDKTRSAFIVDDNIYWYRTGDYVEVSENGKLFFIGRKDLMIKRRGYRIEAGEIQRVISSLNEIKESIVISNGNVQPKILAFCLCENDALINKIEIRQKVAEFLPLYMMPDNFYFLKEFPLTSSHKIDIQSLKKMANA